VGFSHLDIGRAVARFFMERGRKRFALVTADDERAGRRAAAFSEAVVQAGLPPVTTISVGAQRSLRSGRDALGRLLQQCPEVDAVFCSSDLLALGVVTEARARQLSVPGQLAIMGFGDVPFVADLLPALSTVHINGAHIGHLAARYLIDCAEGRSVDHKVVEVDFSIVERDTT
jgi:LacI family gluconate utilization system Gnt-I transcriptional repressor